jgi:hypothetical protein
MESGSLAEWYLGEGDVFHAGDVSLTSTILSVWKIIDWPHDMFSNLFLSLNC